MVLSIFPSTSKVKLLDLCRVYALHHFYLFFFFYRFFFSPQRPAKVGSCKLHSANGTGCQRGSLSINISSGTKILNP